MAQPLKFKELMNELAKVRKKYMGFTLGQALKSMPDALFKADASMPKESGVFEIKADTVASTWSPLNFVGIWKAEEQGLGSTALALATDILDFLKLAGSGRPKPRI